ncbi:MAG: hypothetical protein LAO76_06910 [Acidobacteriia bacterium]|nr:hypothetical protein [Terriglobia bacterium]
MHVRIPRRLGTASPKGSVTNGSSEGSIYFQIFLGLEYRGYNSPDMLKSVIAVLIGLCVSAYSQEAKKQPKFSTTEEVDLVLSQSERAFEQYDMSIKLEAALPSMHDSRGVEKDRQIVELGNKLISGLKKNPNAFHGLGGFLLLGALDDASRNAALCSASAFADISSALLSEKGLDKAKVYELMQIGQSCQDVSTQLYTISENLHALMIRELEGQSIINEQALDALNQCTAVLKKYKPPNSK